MSDNVCAVVVTYNRKNLLIECLEALQKQTRPIQGIYLIDNASTDGTPELLLEKSYITELPPKDLKEPWEKEFEIKNLTDGSPIKIHYVRMHENTGGAGGFYEGVKRGYEKGYDWLWLMDDDAEPKEDALEKLSLFFHNDETIGLASAVLLPDNSIATSHRGKIDFENIFPLIQKPLDTTDYQKKIIKVDFASFVGLLLKRDAIENSGFPKREFFIYHDDVEYCLRLQSFGKILLITDSIIIHKENSKNYPIKSFFGRMSERRFSNINSLYYNIRNIIWLTNKYSKNKLSFYIHSIKYITKLIIGVLTFDDEKYKRIKYILNAYIDGLKGNFDNKKFN